MVMNMECVCVMCPWIVILIGQSKFSPLNTVCPLPLLSDFDTLMILFNTTLPQTVLSNLKSNAVLVKTGSPF